MNYPVYRPTLNGNEMKYVQDCIQSSWISSKGKYIQSFEEKFAEYIGITHAASVSNGTVALHAALLALNVEPGDEVIVPTFTYIASVNAIKYCNATPVFVDSLESTWQMDPDKVRKSITSRTKVILVVHLYGHPCNMEEIMKIAGEFNLLVLEDCAEALGAKFKGKSIGTFGNIATFSFFGNKTITTGEGGMVISDDPGIIDRVRHIKGQGLAKDREYWHDIIGYNYRMTNICAAIGLAQLENVHAILARKKQIASWYHEKLKNSGFLTNYTEDPDIDHAYWMFSILSANYVQRDALRVHLSNHGIETRPLFPPIHLMPMYYNDAYTFPVAEELGNRGINLPSYPDLTLEDVTFITDKILTYRS
ncbi:MAG: DegT/DnrJ/EryC1/StrS family aminotransferase [Bacteroidetes bacterium]|nr:DegT/DnrJ/EryC1/StrS family aminotransferase [Bacteroidota bacterium]